MKGDKHKIRALIHQEWTAKRTVKQAHQNICGQLGYKAVSNSTVRAWYKKFDHGNTNLRNKNDKDYDQPLILPNAAYLPNNKAILFKVDSWPLRNGFTTHDGRIGFVFNDSDAGHTAFVATDLFHGKSAAFTTEDGEISRPRYTIGVPEPVDEERIFLQAKIYTAQGYTYHLFLLRIDYDKFSCKVIGRCELDRSTGTNFPRKLLVDRADCNNFVFLQDKRLRRGQITNDGIIVDEPIQIDFVFFCAELNDNEIRAMVWSPGGRHPHYFVKYNLVTNMLVESIELERPYVTWDSDDWYLFEIAAYTWSDTAFFMAAKEYCEKPFIYKLELADMSWSKLNIKILGTVTSMFIDEAGFLTVSAFESTKVNEEREQDKPNQVAVYRFALKRPDSLINLAWRTIRFYKNFKDSNIYEKIFGHLPYNSHLRCTVPDA